MRPYSIWTLNKRILQNYNRCENASFKLLIDDILSEDCPLRVKSKIFTSKRYLWNIIRPRDFYKMISYCIVEMIRDEKINLAEDLLKMVLVSTEHWPVRKALVWDIMKKVPLLTVDTIQYASYEKVRSILQSNKEIIADDCVRPFLEEIQSMRKDIEMLQTLNNLNE